MQQDPLAQSMRRVVTEAVQDMFTALLDQGFVVASKQQSTQSSGPQREYLTETDVSERYNIPRKTLAFWRSEGRGPKYSKPGMRVLYRKADVDAFMAKYTVRTIDDQQVPCR